MSVSFVDGHIDGKQTNYDRIRNMSVEELSNFLENTNASLAIKLCDNYVVKEKIYIKQWLESEVTEE